MATFRSWMKSVKRRIFLRLGLVMQTDMEQLQQEDAALRQETAALRQETDESRQEITLLRGELNSVNKLLRGELNSVSTILFREQLNAASVLRQDLTGLRQELEAHQVIQPPQTRICCLVPYSYSLFNPSTNYIFGGSEVRAWLLGTGLARNPQYDVFFMVFDHGQPPIEVHNNVKVHRASSFLKALPAPSEAFWPDGIRAGKLFINEYEVDQEKLSFMSYLNADVYCVWGVHNLAAEIAAICERDAKKLILFGGSDSDFSHRYSADSRETDSYGRTGHLCYYAIMKSNLIVTQNHGQAELLKKQFGRNSVTLYNPVDLSGTESTNSKRGSATTCLWVGKADETKQPDIVLLLASRFPDTKFVMVMNKSDSQIYEQVVQTAPPNVHILESVSFPAVEDLFREAFVFINTSRFEGFPNTFLQAGKYGVPVLSLQVDPDGFIDRFTCGIDARGKFEELEIGLRRLMNDSTFYSACADNIYNYVRNYHDLNDKVNELSQIIKDVQEGRL